jgi:hypothetical protein
MHAKTLLKYKPVQHVSLPKRHFVPLILFLFLFVIGGALFFLDAVLPLRDLWFYNALLTLRFRDWLLIPTHLLFPHTPILSFQAGVHRTKPATLTVPWQETRLLLAAFGMLFLCYLLAVCYLPRYISPRFIILSTMLFGIFYLCVPVATSEDLFSYIAYGRMLIIYHTNPLITAPAVIHHDRIYPYLYWIHQPSIYGPVWVILCGVLQWLALLSGFASVASMVLLLRLFSLSMHLGSVWLIWSISGRLQSIMSYYPISRQQRLRAMLAFAWNPLLLVEACINAHVDTTMLFFVLLAIWMLLLRVRYPLASTTLAAILLAVASCIKITIVLLLPGLLLFLWLRYMRGWLHASLATLAYCGTLFLLYAPFWDHGAVLHILNINPGAFHAINSPYATLIYLSASLRGSRVLLATASASSHIEHVMHVISVTFFVIAYGVLYLWSLYDWKHDTLFPAFLHWMALVWLLYCLVGSPWFWPWYMVTFLGIYALLEASDPTRKSFLRLLNLPMAVRLLSFGLLSLYCFLSFAPVVSFLPGMKHFTWTELGGVWIWCVPLLALRLPPRPGSQPA